MMLFAYVTGVIVMAFVWATLTRWRMKSGRSNGIKMPGRMGYLLDPITPRFVELHGYNVLLVGTVIASVIWPLTLTFLTLMFVLAWVCHGIGIAFSTLFGDERIAKAIFGR